MTSTQPAMWYATVPGDEDRELGAVSHEAPVVVEFWNARCARCPRALAGVKATAPAHGALRFVCMNLSIGNEEAAEREYVHEVSQDGWPDNVAFGYMTFERKEVAKQELGFASLPFCAILVRGEVKFRGDPLDEGTLAFALTDASNCAAGHGGPA